MTADTMFGCRVAELHMFVRDHVGPGKKYANRQVAIWSLMSSAQNVMVNDTDAARKMLNQAKWLLAGGDRRRKIPDQRHPSYGDFAGIDRRIEDVD